MITVYRKNETTANGNKIEMEIELRGLSTDDKPTDVSNGTTFIEIDTGKIYMFDADNEQWKEM